MIRYAELTDKAAWFALDGHLPEAVFDEKVRNKQGYVCVEDNRIIGILRYNLFWDSVPFCTLLFIDSGYRGKGCGMVMVSTQADEDAQHFYRKSGYKDAGGFVVDVPGYEQPMEMIMIKGL